MDVIRVNDVVITDRDIDRAMVRYIIQLEEDERVYEPTPENLKFLRVEASNALISRTLLLERARREGCVVGDEELDAEMQAIRSNFETPADWENNLMMFQLSEADVRREVQGDLMIERLLNKMEEEEPITDGTVSSFYEMNMQFLKEPTLYTFYEISAANQEKLQEVVQSLKKQQDILALQKSIEDLGETFLHHVDVVEGSIPEEVRRVLADLSPLEIGTMLLPEGGFVVYKLLSRVEGKQRSLESVRSDLRQYLEKERRVKVYQRLLDEEMERAKITYLHVEYFEKR